MWSELKDFVNYSSPYGFLLFMKSFSISLQSSLNVLFFDWVNRIVSRRLRQIDC